MSPIYCRGFWAHFCGSQTVLHLYLVKAGWMSKHLESGAHFSYFSNSSLQTYSKSTHIEYILKSFTFGLFSTVGNWVVKSAKSDNQNIRPLVTCLFSDTLVQSQNFRKSVSLFGLRKGQLRKQISRVLLRFYFAYILVRNVFLSAFQKCLQNFQLIYNIKVTGKNVWKYVEKS
jgi:hypothetical protein